MEAFFFAAKHGQRAALTDWLRCPSADPTDIAPVSEDVLVSEMPVAPHVQSTSQEPEPEPEVRHIEDSSAPRLEVEEASVPPVGTTSLVSEMPAAPHVEESKSEEVKPVEDKPEPVKPTEGKDASAPTTTDAPATSAVDETKTEETKPAASPSKGAHISSSVRPGGLVSDMPSAAHVEKGDHAGASSPSAERTEHEATRRSDSPLVGHTGDGTPLSDMPTATRHVNDASEVCEPEPSGYMSPEVKQAMSLRKLHLT